MVISSALFLSIQLISGEFGLHEEDIDGSFFIPCSFKSVNCLGVPKPLAVPTEDTHCVRWCYVLVTADPRLSAKSLLRAFISTSKRSFLSRDVLSRVVILEEFLRLRSFVGKSWFCEGSVVVGGVNGTSLFHVFGFGSFFGAEVEESEVYVVIMGSDILGWLRECLWEVCTCAWNALCGVNDGSECEYVTLSLCITSGDVLRGFHVYEHFNAWSIFEI